MTFTYELDTDITMMNDHGKYLGQRSYHSETHTYINIHGDKAVRKESNSSAVAEMGDRLATIDMGRMWETAVPSPSFFFGGGAGSPSNTVARAKAYFHTKWRLSPSSRWPQ